MIMLMYIIESSTQQGFITNRARLYLCCVLSSLQYAGVGNRKTQRLNQLDGLNLEGSNWMAKTRRVNPLLSAMMVQLHPPALIFTEG